MQSHEIRKRFLEFFEKRGHKFISSAPLVLRDDPTTLFTGSGMQPMLPYLLGKTHPLGTRIVNSQNSFRTDDINEVGDNRHTTFFEMLGNWSFGDYFREEQIKWVSEYLFDEIGIDPKKLFVTVFAGDKKNNLDKDIESANLWEKIFKEKGIDAKIVTIGDGDSGSKLGMQDGRIFYYDSEKNWWSRAGIPDNMPIGEPGGPDSEMFYEFSDIKHDPKFGKECHVNCDCGRYSEIGNNVFMTHRKVDDNKFEPLPSKNVDFGGGLERITSASQNEPDIFKIDIFKEQISNLEKLSGKTYDNILYQKSFRIIADHIRATKMLIENGVRPSNTDQGYVLRRLLRRVMIHADKLGIKSGTIFSGKVERGEEIQFKKTLERGLKEFEKMYSINIGGTHHNKELQPDSVFKLVTTYGFPLELVKEIAIERGLYVDESAFEIKMKEHQKISKPESNKKFKGGLAGGGEKETHYHTATHLLHKALQRVLGESALQRGSNITSDRLRFDFVHSQKMTDQEKKDVEDLVNQKINEGLPVSCEEMTLEEAKKIGATGLFEANYGERVTVYKIGDDKTDVFSLEICGGPHIFNTSELGHFKIKKEEAISSGVRRIRAVLE